MKKNLTIVILSILVILLSGYIAYDKVLNTSNNKNNNNIVNNNKDNENDNENDNINNEAKNEVNDVDKNNQYPEEIWKEETDNNEGESLQVVDSSSSKEYLVTISKEGKLIVTIDNQKYTLEVDDVVYTTKAYREIGPLESLFILTEKGDVYEYDLTNIENKNYAATKINSNITSMFSFNYRGWNKGGCSGILGLNNDKYVEIVKTCV